MLIFAQKARNSKVLNAYTLIIAHFDIKVNTVCDFSSVMTQQKDPWMGPYIICLFIW